MRLYNKFERRVCTEERKSISIVEGGERGYVQVYIRTIKERVYQTLKVTSNSTSIFHRKKRWEAMNSTRLLIFQ